MTTYHSTSIACGNCGVVGEQTQLGSTNAFGSSDLDLRPPEMQRSTMHTWVQECSACGYVAGDITEKPADAAVIQAEPYRAALTRDGVPELARLFSAHAIATEATDPPTAAWAYLRAAWSCDDARATDLADEFRGRAAELFGREKPFTGPSGLTTGAILVDVLRRCGRFTDAAPVCEELLLMDDVPDLVRSVLQYQQRLIARSDTAAHTVAECETDV